MLYRAVFSPYITDRTDISNANQHPGIHHWLGTDQCGRDVLTRLMLAGQISLTVGLASMVLSLVIGSLLGAAAGFYRGAADMIIMRIADMLMSIPGLPLLLILAAVMSEWKVPSEYRMYLIMMMLSLIGWPGLARLVRGQILSLKEQPFMMAAEVLGLSDKRKILYHLLPNTLPLLLVAATLHVAGAMLSESALSFLGRRCSADTFLGKHDGSGESFYGFYTPPVAVDSAGNGHFSDRCGDSSAWRRFKRRF